MSDGLLEFSEAETLSVPLIGRVEEPLRVPPPVEFPGGPDAVPTPLRRFARPTYLERFQCVGGACEDTCCQGWGVPVDQVTFEKYRAHPALKPHIGTLIVLNHHGPTKTDFARLPLTEDGSCAFLDTDRMCGLQRQFGAEMLSETCATYPRAISIQGGEVERALNLSCPEAARVILLEPHLLKNVDWQKEGTAHYDGVRAWAAQALGPGETRLAVRQFALMLVTDRSYPLWQRVYLLGILARRLGALAGDMEAGAWCERHPAEVEAMLLDSARAAGGGVLRTMMDELQGNTARQLQFVAAMLRLRIPGPPMPKRFIECLQEYEAGLGCNAADEAVILAGYAKGYESYYRPVMSEHPYLLENYLINHIFKNQFPFGRRGDTTTPEAEHTALAVNLAAAQALLVGMARFHQESFGIHHVVKLVQSLAKTIEHGKAYLEQVAALAGEEGLNNLHGVAILLRQDVP